MPAMDSSSVPFAAIGRSILSIRRDQVHSSPTVAADSDQDQDLESFQKHVAELFSDLGSNSDEILSLAWIGKLLDAFLISQEEFRVIFLTSKSLLSKPPIDRIIGDFFDRTVKALDLCNAIRDGIDQIRQWIKHLAIVTDSIGSRHGPISEGQIRRSKKALMDLSILMIDEKDAAISSHRNRSFGRNNNSNPRDSSRKGHFRSLSWSVSRSWSASKQLHAIGNNLNAPRGNEISHTNGFAVPVYTMSSVLLFTTWALVAAIPCQDRGIQIHFSIPRSFSWASALITMHEKIMEESKKKERKGCCGLMKEIISIEKTTRSLLESLDSVQHLPMEEEKEAEVRAGVEEIAGVCRTLKEGLDLLEKQVKEVFHRIVRSRTEGLDCIGKSHNGE